MRKHIKSSAGFSLIELMVGALIGLIATVIIFQMFAVAESQKRATTGASDSLQSGTQALFQLERDVALAGYGLSRHLFGCTINGWFDTGQPGGQLLKLNLLPVFITNGVGNQSDSITVFSASTDKLGNPTGLRADQAAPELEYEVLNTYGFNPGDLTIAMNYLATAPAEKDCTLAQVSRVSGADIQHLPGSYVTLAGLSKQTQFNRPGGLPAPANVLYKNFDSPTKGGGLLFNLGSLPRILTYRVQGTDLVIGNEFLPAGQPEVVAENVVQFQAHYAVDGGNHLVSTPGVKPDGVFNAATAKLQAISSSTNLASTTLVDHWSAGLSSNNFKAAEWSKILAIRMAVVTRGEYVKPDPGMPCTASTANPTWESANLPLDVSGVPDWQCYRYKVQEMTVPLRNITWAPQELGIQPPLTN